jgi:hypothetical protein
MAITASENRQGVAHEVGVWLINLIPTQEDAMKSFIAKHAEKIIGVLSGFDRLVFRGTLRRISFVGGMMDFLWKRKVLLKEFGLFAQEVTDQVKEASCRAAKEKGRPVKYLYSSGIDKEAVAREIQAEDGITEGLIAVLKSVELCMSYDIYRNREEKRLELVPRKRKCLYLYHYFIDPVFGFMNARIQTWFPFPVQICLNGREWLSRQMDRAGIAYDRLDNCFPWIEDVVQAQNLMNRQLRKSWPRVLGQIARMLNPAHEKIFKGFPLNYYWSTYQSEWATDVMFKDAGSLGDLYSTLVHHGITTFGSGDVMRFLGKRVPDNGGVHHRFEGEVVSTIKRRPEGVRINHGVNGNSVKLYDKEGSVLRVETTVNNAHDFKVWRPRDGEKDDGWDWRIMRKGVADLYRRTQVSQASNERYLDALASVEGRTPVGELAKDICRPTKWKGQRIRALRPWSPEDGSLLAVVSRGEYAINGFRNRDLRKHLFGLSAFSETERLRRSRSVTRKLRLLRAHGLIKKVPRTHRYVLTDRGRLIITGLIAARKADVTRLTEAA